MDPRLGRLEAKDDRDKNFPFSSVLRPGDMSVIWRYWITGPILDQGQTPECVAYAWKQWLVSGPVWNEETDPLPDKIYQAAQAIDEWAGSPHDGTSVRAGAKVLQSLGFVSNYVWSTNITDLQAWLFSHGPVVVGVNWYENMFNPASSGVVTVDGNLAGGHAFLVDGWNQKTRLFRCANSWSRDWGKNGYFYIKEADMQRLVYDEGGEACTALEIKK